MKSLLQIHLVSATLQLLIWGICTAQPVNHYKIVNKYSFQVFQLPGGKIGNNVDAIVQDSLGYLWFGSLNGLSRYDGNQFRTFQSNAPDQNGLTDNYISALLVDQKGVLWIGTEKGGLLYYDSVNETIIPFKKIIPFPDQEERKDLILTIIEDKGGYLWIGTHGNGLYKINPSRTAYEHFLFKPDDENSLSDNIINNLYQDRAGTIWICTGVPWRTGKLGGLNKYNPEFNNFTRFLPEPKDPGKLNHKCVLSVLEDRQGNFWVATSEDGLYLMNRSKGTFERFPSEPAKPERLSAPYSVNSNADYQMLRRLFEDKDGQIWGISFTDGIVIFDPLKGLIQRYDLGIGKNKDGVDQIPSAHLWNIHQSKDGNIWLAGGGGGKVIRIKKNNQAFEYKNLGSILGLSDIISFHEDTKECLWLGKETGGIIRYDPNSEKVEELLFQKDINPEKNTGQILIKSIFQDKNKRIWLGSVGNQWHKNGILKVSDDGFSYHHFPNLSNGMAAQGSIYDIHEDINGDFWFGSSMALYRYSFESSEIQFFSHNEHYPNSLKNASVFKLFTDSRGYLWIMGGKRPERIFLVPNEGFLDMWNPSEKQFIHHLSSRDDNLIGHGPFTMVEDQIGNLWFASYQGGLHRYHPETKVVTFFNPAEGNFPEMDIRWLLKDDKNQFWIGTPNFIYLFNPENGNHKKYDFFTDLPGENSYNQALIREDGTILFTWGSGYYQFNPNNLKQIPPELIFSDFWIGQEKILPKPNGVLTHPITQTQKLSLSHNQNSFTLGLANFQYDNPSHNRIKYKLEPYDQKWHETGSAQLADYYHVPTGIYHFKAKGISSRGMQSAEKEIIIEILPSKWLSWWALSSYAFIILGLLFLVRWWELKKQQRKIKEQQHINTITNKFVPNAFIHSLGKKNIMDVKLGDAVEKRVTVMFSDIRNYTTLSEKMTPNENFQFVYAFDQRMGPIIHQNHGFVNQYLGDAIMALFKKSPKNALTAAIKMQEALRDYNIYRIASKRMPIQFGIGMHTGSLMMGIIGDSERMDTAIISDTVNTASRIEGLTKFFGVNILLSEDSMREIQANKTLRPEDPSLNFHFRHLGKVQLKGKKEFIKIYECIDGDKPDIFEKKLHSYQLFKEGMTYYFSRQFSKAQVALEKVVQINTADSAAKLFLEKTEELLNKGIPEDWTEVEIMKYK